MTNAYIFDKMESMNRSWNVLMNVCICFLFSMEIYIYILMQL